MADLFENPIGTDGFEFVEYTSGNPDELAALFERLGQSVRVLDAGAANLKVTTPFDLAVAEALLAQR